MKDKQHPLLTKDQLIDWLIYHVPLQEGGDNDKPFIVEYRSKRVTFGWSITVFGETPWQAYEEMANKLINYGLQGEITDLYWYWTL